MVHISKIAKERINRVEDVLTLGDKVTVVCLGKDKMGRISFSIKDVPQEARLEAGLRKKDSECRRSDGFRTAECEADRCLKAGEGRRSVVLGRINIFCRCCID